MTNTDTNNLLAALRIMLESGCGAAGVVHHLYDTPGAVRVVARFARGANSRRILSRTGRRAGWLSSALLAELRSHQPGGYRDRALRALELVRRVAA